MFAVATVGGGAAAEQSISSKANSEPAYRALRDAAPEQSVHVEALRLVRDAGEFTFTGVFTFSGAVLGVRPYAVFNGKGEFRLDPKPQLERRYLKSLTEKEVLSDTFEKAFFCVSDGTADEILKAGKAVALDPRAVDLLKDFRDRLRDHKHAAENLDAEMLADLYNRSQRSSFRAFLRGSSYSDLRFIVRPQGAVPELPAAEEVGVLNLDESSKQSGVMYLAHMLDEYTKGTARSDEEKRVAAPEHYKLDVTIAGNEHLAVKALVRIRAISQGDRAVRFGLLPNLRVSRVTVGGREASFIQEGRKQDGDFHVILPEAMTKGSTHEIGIEYEGNEVIHDAGGGNFSVGARTSWYPSLNSFLDQATYDITFRVPKKYTLVSVGQPVKEWTEDKHAVSQWVSQVPLAVAGFNYGQFKKKEVADAGAKYVVAGYAASSMPDYLRGDESVAQASPSALLEKTLAETQISIRLFQDWFGPAPYGRIAITQQPEFSFGQSWPGLVYLPLSAYLDSTQRWQLLGTISRELTDFVHEVTPHEVAHQWWGHMVGWASFHDQWISEGFADFSAGLFLQFTEKKPDKFLKYLERSRDRIIEKNQYGRRANDAGPVWMGLRLSTFHNAGAYNSLVYAKGGYILHMLRMLMWDAKTGDETFKTMMREFVTTHLHKPATTEGFKRLVDKYMNARMDVTRNKRMDWFFAQWVLGTDIPRYKLDYTVTPQDGKFLVNAKVTQSEVSESFAMPVPIYAEFDNGRIARLGTVTLVGNSSQDGIQIPLPMKPKRMMLNYLYDVLEMK